MSILLSTEKKRLEKELFVYYSSQLKINNSVSYSILLPGNSGYIEILQKDWLVAGLVNHSLGKFYLEDVA